MVSFKLLSERDRFNVVKRDLLGDSHSLKENITSSMDKQILNNDEIFYLKPEFILSDYDFKQLTQIQLVTSNTRINPLFDFFTETAYIPTMKLELHRKINNYQLVYSTTNISDKHSQLEIKDMELLIIDTDNKSHIIISSLVLNNKETSFIDINIDPRCVIVDPYNKYYLFTIYDLNSLNYIIESGDFSKDDRLLLKLINDLFYLVYSNQLSSIHFVTFVRNQLRFKLNLDYINPISLIHALSLMIYSVKNFFYENDQSPAKNYIFKLITEKLIDRNELSVIKGVLIENMIDIVNINDSDQIKYVLDLIFLPSPNNISDSSDKIFNDNHVTRVCSRRCKFQLYSVLFESPSLSLYERNLLKDSLITIYSPEQRFYLESLNPNTDLKAELSLNFTANYYKNNTMTELLMRAFNRRNQYPFLLKIFMKKKFFIDFSYVIRNYDLSYSMLYYSCMNPSEIVSLRVMEKYSKFRGNNLNILNANPELAMEFETDFERIKRNIRISNCSDSFILKDSEN